MSSSSKNDTPYLNFPPFYTLQPCEQTKLKQLQMWVKYVIEYCKNHDVREIVIESFPLFENRSIDRSLSQDMRQLVMAQLCQEGYAHCQRPGVYSVVQKSVQDWAYTIYNWIIANGYGMEVMDLEDIRSGDRVCHESFYNLNEGIFKDCINVLVKDGKAQFITDESVRFL